uniref:Uncharacterized protein n=1 Tax=Pelusios castaneus TaxID=367368 RepID=A0A8C8RNK7_9SAUR
MASEAHNVRKWNLLHAKDCHIDHRQSISHSTNKNMKEYPQLPLWEKWVLSASENQADNKQSFKKATNITPIIK